MDHIARDMELTIDFSTTTKPITKTLLSRFCTSNYRTFKNNNINFETIFVNTMPLFKLISLLRALQIDILASVIPPKCDSSRMYTGF